jgi:hypothetical protein
VGGEVIVRPPARVRTEATPWVDPLTFTAAHCPKLRRAPVRPDDRWRLALPPGVAARLLGLPGAAEGVVAAPPVAPTQAVPA